MDLPPVQSISDQTTAVRGLSRVVNFAAWFAVSLIASIVLARLAVLAQTHAGFAPLVIFPVLVGLTVGAVAMGLRRLFAVPRGKRVLLAVAVLAGATVAAEHYFFFREQRQSEFRRALERTQKEHARQEQPPIDPALVPPLDLGWNSFVRYVDSQAAYPRPLLWALDAGLVILAALGLVILSPRLTPADPVEINKTL